MNITVQIKTVYGNDLIYPACAQAQLFAKMLGTKSLTEQAISYIKQLGYKVIVKSRFETEL